MNSVLSPSAISGINCTNMQTSGEESVSFQDKLNGQTHTNQVTKCTPRFCVNQHIVVKQASEIHRLKQQLTLVSTERDALMCEIQHLKMEILAKELGNLDMDTSTTTLENEEGTVDDDEDIDNLPVDNKDHIGPIVDDVKLRSKVYNEDGRLTDPYVHFFSRSKAYRLRLCRSTYSSSSAMTRLSSSSSSSSASSSPVLFTASQSSASQFHDPIEDTENNGVVERRYGGPPARNAALIIQRAFRRYSMVKEFHRIKERRISRRINNNGVGTSGSNGCEICIDLHHESHHQHPAETGEDVEVLEDEEELSLPSSGEGIPRASSCAQVDEVEIDPTGHLRSTASSGQLIITSITNNHGHHPMNSHHGFNNSRHHCSNNKTTCQSSPKLNSSHSENSVNVLSSRQQQQHPMHNRTAHHPHYHHHHSHHDNHIPTQQQQSHYQHPDIMQQQQQPQLLESTTLLNGASVQKFSSNSTPALHQPLHLQKTVSGSSGNSSTGIVGSPLSTISPNLSASSGGSPNNKTRQNNMSDAECEIVRKRLYRVGLNMFNKKPEAGITYLVKKKFLEGSAPAVARFLISRKGLSKQMIGEYLANLQSPFSMSCLEHFASEIDLSNMPVDLALRRFQTFLRMPGEAQKIERVMESFSRRYGVCNPQIASQFRSGADTVFVLAFAIIMLNTDLHTPHLKHDRRMKLDDFIKNLRGIDEGGDIDREILVGIYERIKQTEFKTGSDHVTQVMKVQQTIVGKKPNLALPHRRLVCYCRLYEVADVNKKEKAGSHQREVFLFNDLLVLTKIFHKKRNSVTYSFRQSYPLQGITLSLFSNANQNNEFGLTLKRGDTILLHLNARNEHDRAKFAEDLREAIAESDEMARIENLSKKNRDRDSGVDVGKIKRFSNSLLDINDQCKPTRRGSCGSLDSGMSISFHSDELHQQGGAIVHHNSVGSSSGSQSSSSQNNNSHPPIVPHHQHQSSSCSSSSQSSNNSHK